MGMENNGLALDKIGKDTKMKTKPEKWEKDFRKLMREYREYNRLIYSLPDVDFETKVIPFLKSQRQEAYKQGVKETLDKIEMKKKKVPYGERDREIWALAYNKAISNLNQLKKSIKC